MAVDIDIRSCLLQVIAERTPKRPTDGALQSRGVLEETRSRLNGGRDIILEQAILAAFQDLFRTGHLSWGYDFCNPDPPFFHITSQGRKALEIVGRDPANPDGYFRCLLEKVIINPISESYLREGVACFNQDLLKAAAVMVGGASESLALELRDTLVRKLQSMQTSIPNGLQDRWLKKILDVTNGLLSEKSSRMPTSLRESFQAYWPAFLQQIRVARNDAGHPSSVEPVSYDTVHASLLIFPELALLTQRLCEWIESDLV